MQESLGQVSIKSPAQVTRDRHRVVKTWIALILWLIVITVESTSYLSSHNTSRFLYPLLHFLFGIDYATFKPLHYFLRKGGHVFGYGLLSILLFRAWRETLPAEGGARWTLRRLDPCPLPPLVIDFLPIVLDFKETANDFADRG